MLTWIYFKNNKSLENLKVLSRIIFVSGVFQNFDADFWPLLKAEKVLAPKQFWWNKNFSSKFYFLSSIWTYKLSASWITENSSHCYPLSFKSISKDLKQIIKVINLSPHIWITLITLCFISSFLWITKCYHFDDLIIVLSLF